MNTQTIQNTAPSGISGRRLITIVLMLLAISGATLSYTLWCYSRLDVARAETTLAWRALAEELSERYAAIASQAAAGDGLPEFTQAVDRFRTTVQTGPQRTAALEVEQQLARLATNLPTPSDPLNDALNDFNRVVEQEAEVLGTPGGRVLSIFLSFPPPIRFELTEALP